MRSRVLAACQKLPFKELFTGGTHSMAHNIYSEESGVCQAQAITLTGNSSQSAHSMAHNIYGEGPGVCQAQALTRTGNSSRSA